MADPATVIAGYLVLAIVVALYTWWEWTLSADDRQRRDEQLRRLGQ